ncbi:hypothetical protein [Martelella sp. FOR1707]
MRLFGAKRTFTDGDCDVAKENKPASDQTRGSTIPQEKAKQGTTVLRTRFARIVFVGGLVLFILLALSTLFFPWREDTGQQPASITLPE